MGGFNYPLLVKLLYMIVIISLMIAILHPEEVKKAIKYKKIEIYPNKNKI